MIRTSLLCNVLKSTSAPFLNGVRRNLISFYSTTGRTVPSEALVRGNAEMSQQLDSRPIDIYKFNYSFASYAHHAARSLPQISSLSDLSDSNNLSRLVPKRRPPGSDVDTLSIKNGEDAMLLSPSLLAVADGVSSWSAKMTNKSDSGLWARCILETMSRDIVKYKIDQYPNLLNKRDVDQILDESFLHTTNLMAIDNLEGSSTILMAMVIGDKLKVISIGDSKIYLIRDGELVATNKEQMKSDMCPFQIGTHHLDTYPSQVSWMDLWEVKEGDLVVLASDGLSDNLWEDEIISYIDEKYRSGEANLQEVANYLLYKAKDVAFDSFAICPYTEKLNSLPSRRGTFVGMAEGGKVDDISICIGEIVQNSR